ncbi:BIP4 [Symbiodinium sp. CCMP2592]|nr:BIP4 [Symbiodinium sp. CCMP2592]
MHQVPQRNDESNKLAHYFPQQMGVEGLEGVKCVSNMERQDVLALRNKAVPVASSLEGNLPTVAVTLGLQAVTTVDTDPYFEIVGARALEITEVLQLQATIRKTLKRTVSADAKLLNQISNKDLLKSHVQHLAEDLGIGGRKTGRFDEISLIVTDWEANMPVEVMDILVQFLETRQDGPREVALVQLDLHGKLPRLLAALRKNREFFESSASSVETLELSLEDVDPHQVFIPLFPNLSSLRLYRPEFPSNRADVEHLGMRLLSLNSETLRDVAVVGLDADDAVFQNVITCLPRSDCSSTTLWLVSGLDGIRSALGVLGDELEKARRSGRTGTFVSNLAELKIHVQAPSTSFDTIRCATKLALNRGLTEEAQAARRLVRTTIRSTLAAAPRNDDILMCLFDVTALSVGIATSEGFRLLESGETLPARVLQANISQAEGNLLVEAGTLGGALVLELTLAAESTAAMLVDSISSRLGWNSATCFLHDLQVQPHMSLANYQVLTIKEQRDIKMTRLIERNSVYPTKTSRRFAVRSSNVAIQLLEGEASLASQNHVLGELELDGLTADSAVDITLDIDANGILRVKAVGLSSGKSADLVVDDRHRWSCTEIEHMIAQAEQSWRQTASTTAKSKLFNQCTRLLEDLHETEHVELASRALQWLEDNDTCEDVKLVEGQLQALDALNKRIADVLTLEDIVEEIIQEEIVDETDVYVDVDRQLKIQGRNERKFDLGVFNPIWRSKADKLSLEEVNAISAHLTRTAFTEGSRCPLKYETVTWLVGEAEVMNLRRNAASGQGPTESDMLYTRGHETDRCTLILQGRLGAFVGHESFKTENGAFSVLARDALTSEFFTPDFDAFLSTSKVRILSIKRDTYNRAVELEKNPALLEKAKRAQAHIMPRMPTAKRLSVRNRTGTDGEERQKVFELQVLDKNQHQYFSKASYPAALPGCAEDESPATPTPNFLLLCST